MASRRKSSTPCMLPPSGEDADRGVAEPSSRSSECEYCGFGAQTPKLLAESGNADAPDVCAACRRRRTGSGDAPATRNPRHRPGQGKLTLESRDHKDGGPPEREDGGRRRDDGRRQGIALSKTPIMRSRAEPKKLAASRRTAAEDVVKVESEDETDEDEAATDEAAPAAPPPLPVPAPPQSLLLNCPDAPRIKGGALPAGTLAQVLSALPKRHQSQLLVPVSSIPAYHAAMDNNVLLLGAYNRFPYPSPSEIAALASQTKFGEENVKVWFSAQRLKRGVSWTPEEVEEERRKTSDGAVQTLRPSVPHAIAVVAANGLQSIFQTCQIVGPPGLLLAQVGGRPDGNLPVALAVAAPPPPPPSKGPAESPAERASWSAASDSASKTKKSKEQLAQLKASYGRRRFATDGEISRLMQVTGLSKRAIKKWFSDTRYNQRNSRDPQHGGGAAPVRKDEKDAAAIVIDSSDDAGHLWPTCGNRGSPRVPRERRAKLRHAFPDFTPQKFKEKTSGQLLVLESSFRKCDTPCDDELTRLRAQTKLTRREVDAWFSDRRKGLVPKGGVGVPPPQAPPPPPPPPLMARGVPKKTPAQLQILKKAFVRSRWPTAQEYDEMARDCGLPRNDVVNWFGETRYAAKNSNLKWLDLDHGGKVGTRPGAGATLSCVPQVDEASPDGAAGTPKKSRKRFRGWSRRTRRAYVGKQDVRAPGKVCEGAKGRARFKSGRALAEGASSQIPTWPLATEMERFRSQPQNVLTLHSEG